MIKNVTEITSLDLTFMELSEEIRYLKREVADMGIRTGKMLVALDNFINYKRKEHARSKRKTKRASNRRKKLELSKLERKRAGSGSKKG